MTSCIGVPVEVVFAHMGNTSAPPGACPGGMYVLEARRSDGRAGAGRDQGSVRPSDGHFKAASYYKKAVRIFRTFNQRFNAVAVPCSLDYIKTCI
jgi:hypothetical protein